ncbi:DUF1489 family protein [Maritalea sp.]|uniref:DUF1489 family protein n=1 Tax=Maritalea sp. TaxID=2003361 RepID=UPI003EF8F3C8
MIHLIKLSVGTTSIQSLAAYRAGVLASGVGRPDGHAWHRTRMMPKRRDELIAGGSIYWVFAGKIQCRQVIVDLEAGTDGEGRGFCDIVIDQTLIPTAPQPKRPFQGWRYLKPEDAPNDLVVSTDGESPPAEMAQELAALGLI